MAEHGFLHRFSTAVEVELEGLGVTKVESEPQIRDLRGVLWASIDNDDSLDLDQLTVAEPLQDGVVKILVAVADVDAYVEKGSAIDRHAAQNTTSVYTGVMIFPMLPERLSTDLTSLNEAAERRSVVTEMVIGRGGEVESSNVYRAWVKNRAKLAYNSVAHWLDGGPMPERMANVVGLDQQIRIQDEVAQRLKRLRHENGALDLEMVEARPVFVGEEIRELAVESGNRAKELIENFMIATNGVTARYLKAKKYPAIRRVVRSPKRWAKDHGGRSGTRRETA